MQVVTIMEILCQLVKGDFEGKFEGIATRKVVDSDNQVINWPGTVKAFKEWSDSQYKASSGKSWGNVRVQHAASSTPAGILTAPPIVDEVNKQILVQGQVFSDESRRLLESGTLCALSIGGAYKERKPLAGGVEEFTPSISELSLVDRGAVPGAVLTYTAASGVTLQKHFHPRDEGFPRYDPNGSWLQKRNREAAIQRAKANGAFCKKQAPTSPRVNPNVSRANEAMTFTDLSNATPVDLAGTGHHTVSSGAAGSFKGRH